MDVLKIAIIDIPNTKLDPAQRDLPAWSVISEVTLGNVRGEVLSLLVAHELGGRLFEDLPPSRGGPQKGGSGPPIVFLL